MTRREAQRQWFAIARTPTWLGRLLIALALAAIFALLGQWQLGRALPAAKSGAPAGSSTGSTATSGGKTLAVELKTFTVRVDSANLEIISGRLQPGSKSGFWLVSNSIVVASKNRADVGHELTIAWGWAASFERAVAAHSKFQASNLGRHALKLTGVLADSEAPVAGHPTQPFLFDSLSLSQLVNVYQPLKPRSTLEQYLIVQPSVGESAVAGLEPIVLAAPPATPLETVNWLSAFYAIEWSVFAGFAVFMWWRLVEDERLRRRAEATES